MNRCARRGRTTLLAGLHNGSGFTLDENKIVARICALLVLPALFLSAGPLFADSSASTAVQPKLHVVLRGQDHHPFVGKKWRYSVAVTNAAGKRVSCRIHLQFLFGGAPVGQIGTHSVKDGFWQETFATPGHPGFPAAARGEPLTIQAIVTAPGYATAKAIWPIVVK